MSSSQSTNADTAIDPVCGMTVDRRTAAGSSHYDGRDYYFCSSGCKVSFDKDPARHTAAAQRNSSGDEGDLRA